MTVKSPLVGVGLGKPGVGEFGDTRDAALACGGLGGVVHLRVVKVAGDGLVLCACALLSLEGAVALDGRLIDIASIKQAENLVKQAEKIAAL